MASPSRSVSGFQKPGVLAPRPAKGALSRGDQPQRHDDQRHQHHRRLEHVRAGDGHEAADERVRRHRQQGCQHPRGAVQAECRLQQLGAGDQAGRDVEDDEEDGDQRRHGAQHTRGIGKAPLQELGHGERIASFHRVTAQALGDDRPTAPDAGHQCQRRPHLAEAVLERQRWKHQDRPSAGARGARAQRGRERSHPPPAKHVVRHRHHALGAHQRDADQHGEVADKYSEQPDVRHRCEREDDAASRSCPSGPSLPNRDIFARSNPWHRRWQRCCVSSWRIRVWRALELERQVVGRGREVHQLHRWHGDAPCHA